MKFHARAGEQKGQILFDSQHVKAHFNDWIGKNPKKPFIIDTDDEVSSALRGFYYSAVVDEIRKCEPKWAHLTSDEIHACICKILFFFLAWNPETQREERFGKKVMSNSDFNNTKKAMAFLDTVEKWIKKKGGTMPDSQYYKNEIRDVAMTHEEFADYQNNNK